MLSKKNSEQPKVPSYEILGAQHLSLDEKIKFFLSIKGNGGGGQR